MTPPWQIPLAEWLARPRTWEDPPRPLSLEGWRTAHGYPNPLDDHGYFRCPNGRTEAGDRRMQRHFAERGVRIVEGARLYQAALAAGEVPEVIPVHVLRADGQDPESVLAAARLFHRRQVRRAVRRGDPVPPAVLADYPELGDDP